MAYGTGLSDSASRALIKQANRPSKAERMQAESIAAQANAASLQRQFASQQDDRNYQRTVDQRNLDRNDRAEEIFARNEQAEYMMERQNEMAVEKQRAQNAFKLQNAMAKRKTNAEPGGTGQPVAGPRPARATLTASGGETLQYSDAGGLTHQPPGIYLPDGPNQLRAPKPQATQYPERFQSPGSREAYDIYLKSGKGADFTRAQNIADSDAAEPEAQQKRVTKLYRDSVWLNNEDRDFEHSEDPRQLNAARAENARQLQDALKERGMREDPSSRRNVRDIDAVPQAWKEQAMRYAQEQGATTDAEFEQYIRDFLKHEGFDNV